MLITSRRRLTALEDVAVISLDTLAPGEAAALLARLAGRPDLGSGAGPAGEITRLCGYLPLAIGMLARQLSHHAAWTAAGMAADLAAARDRLAVMRAENLSVAAAFDLSYQDLTTGQQRLFRRLGLHPGPEIDAYAAAALDDTSLEQARRHLEELYDQHLIAEHAQGRYRLHDLIREHARALAATDDPADAAATRLLDYYMHAAAAAGRHFTFGSTVGASPTAVPQAWAAQLATLQQATAWLEIERPNLHAAVNYAAARARLVHATQIPAAMSDFLLVHGHWDQFAVLHQTAITAARQAGDQPGQAYALIQLGSMHWLTGDSPAATACLARGLALYQDLGDRLGQASALNRLGLVQQQTGDYPGATASHQQALALACDIDDLRTQAKTLNCLGFVQQLTGDYPAATASQQQALALLCKIGDLRGQAYALHDLGVVQQLTGDYPAAATSHQHALKIYRDSGYRIGEAEALNNLGELLTRSSASKQARDHHTQALAIARDINAPLEEARALEGIGRCHLQDGNPGDGGACLRQALTIYQHIGAPSAQRIQETLRERGLQ